MNIGFDNVAVILLAGGRSARMGTPKQMLLYKGRPIINHIIKTILSTGLNQVFVVSGRYHDEITETVPTEVKVIYNDVWESGIASSIRCGITKAIESNKDLKAVMIMLTDQPLIDRLHVEMLVSVFADGSYDAVATDYDGKKGVPAIFASTTFKALNGLSGDSGAKKLFNDVNYNVISIKAQCSLMDIDTLEDYENLLDG